MKQLYLALSGLIAVSTIACGTIEVNPMNIGGEAEVEIGKTTSKLPKAGPIAELQPEPKVYESIGDDLCGPNLLLWPQPFMINTRVYYGEGLEQAANTLCTTLNQERGSYHPNLPNSTDAQVKPEYAADSQDESAIRHIITIGNSCTNPITKMYLGADSCQGSVDLSFEPNKGKVYIMEKSPNQVILGVTGRDAQTIDAMVKIMANSLTFTQLIENTANEGGLHSCLDGFYYTGGSSSE